MAHHILGNRHIALIKGPTILPFLTRCFAHGLDDRLRLHRHARHAHEQVDHLLLVIGETVGIELLADGRSPIYVLV